MLKRKSRQKSKNRKATFSITLSDANEVYLTGSFNNWNPRKHPMHQKENGTWDKTVMIPPGIYEYKFLVDGQWKIDPQNCLICLNCFGTKNSVFDFTRT
jgi:1,4-alpha-glucan branching enzyme